MLLSKKQRRHTYDSLGYARTFTPLTFLIILQLLIKVYLSFDHHIYSMDLKAQKFVGQRPPERTATIYKRI